VLAIVLILGGLVTIAVLAVTAAHRYCGVTAWSHEYGQDGAGLGVELAMLSVVVLGAGAVAVILNESFEKLFLDGGWRTWWLLAPVCVVTAGTALYNVVFAPKALADKHQVASHEVHRQCRRPYLVYTPFSVILWVGLLLPVVALLVVSINTDRGAMADARRSLDRSGSELVALAQRDPEAASGRVPLYRLEHRSAVDTVQRAVTRYLWVVGVFIFFLVVILNTRVTSAYAEGAQDSFKWLMWALLLVAVAICLFGLSRFNEMRNLAIATNERLIAIGGTRDQLSLEIAAREQLLELREDGPGSFLWGAVVGVFGFVAFTYAFQALLAKVTNRSAVEAIFPRSVARFVDGFFLRREEPPAAAG
jgi:hypothetical protein